MPRTEPRAKWDAVAHLKNVDDVIAYLEAAVEEPTRDTQLLRTVIHDAVRALRTLSDQRQAKEPG
jgi:DNA-binding phage protein